MEADALGLSSFQRCRSSIPLSKFSHSSDPAVVQLASGPPSPDDPSLVSAATSPAASTVVAAPPEPGSMPVPPLPAGAPPVPAPPVPDPAGVRVSLCGVQAIASSPTVNADFQVTIMILLDQT